jgi:SAM-dependent methyltransferase
MASQPAGSNEGHLRYYEQHGISPVRYQADDLEAHFDRRDSLYRSLGLPPAAFLGARVLEVAPGSGQNSLYVAACRPASLDLVEPNPAGLSEIRSNYQSFARPHTAPKLHAVRLEAFETETRYDVVLCENWLGSLPSELALMRKLASLVAPGGVLVLTVVPLSGFFPNVMRRLLALRIIDPAASFEQNTARAVEAFGSHLATIKDMTRNQRDWVHDCMLNPHYLNVALSFETVFETVGPMMEALATFPRFTPDWRWFKSLVGTRRGFSEAVLNAYRENLHTLVDYRKVWPPRPAESNASVDDAFSSLHRSALTWQNATTDAEKAQASREIADQLSVIGSSLAEVDPQLGRAVAEVRSIWLQPQLNAAILRDMHEFKVLFGRETVCLSLTRARDRQA